VGAPTTSTPVVSQGLVITASEAGFVNAIDAATGKKVWIHKCGTGEFTKGIIFTTPFIFDGRIYVGNRAGTLYCLDLKAGEEIFTFQAGEKEIYASPKGDGRGIVFGTIDGVIWCIDPKDGKPKWKVEAHREIGATAAILGDTIYIPGKDRNLYEIDYATGNLRRKPPFQLPGTTHCTAALGAGYAFLITGGRKCHAIDLLDGKVVWENDATSDDHIPPGYADGVAYFPLGQFLWAIDGPTGAKLWEFKAEHKVSAPVINGGEVLIAGRDRKFRVIDRKTGTEIWSLDLGEGFVAGPVLVDGVVYLAGDANEGMNIFAVE
jgi:outer membrane protein assembly factor BamB